ncbi:hypothetical protein SteCoe_27849 [Stentor coeruleus]|uniref:Uncharacterized protein n=1 Tax=Stentor coeruleus TaxID=5963 RepID=A0A1R2B9L2_9CILI|nr:hypothetical protein SteCoe_27849 [Stentor coeruleus]
MGNDSRDIDCIRELKIVFLGDSAVGKSSLINQLCYGEFQYNPNQTIGVESREKIYNYNGVNIRLRIFDSSGQPNFRSCLNQYYRNALAVIIVFDLNNYASFKSLSDWIAEANSFEISSLIFVVGNKNDLDRVVLIEDIERFLRKKNINYFETSAANRDNVEKVFSNIFNTIIVSRGSLRNLLEKHSIQSSKDKNHKNKRKRNFFDRLCCCSKDYSS